MPSKNSLAALAVLAAGCRPIHAWDGGYPNPGDDPARFAIEEIEHKWVVIGGKRYSRTTFEPVFRHATPGVLPLLETADGYAGINEAVLAASVMAVSYSVPAEWPNVVDRIRDAGIVGLYGLGLFWWYRGETAYEEARRVYAEEIARKLCRGPVPHQCLPNAP